MSKYTIILLRIFKWLLPKSVVWLFHVALWEQKESMDRQAVNEKTRHDECREDYYDYVELTKIFNIS